MKTTKGILSEFDFLGKRGRLFSRKAFFMNDAIGSRRDLERKMNRCIEHGLTSYLFNDRKYKTEVHLKEVTGCIYEFEMSDYVYFLDHSESRAELLKGLTELSPFADEALEVAHSMSESDFSDFKLALPSERRGEGGTMPQKYVSLLLPTRFFPALLLARKLATTLGTTLVRLCEVELEQK